MAFGGDTTDVVVVVGPGGSETVYFPFDIIQQTVSVCVFTGIDAVAQNIEIASLHAVESGLDIHYRAETAENILAVTQEPVDALGESMQ